MSILHTSGAKQMHYNLNKHTNLKKNSISSVVYAHLTVICKQAPWISVDKIQLREE